MAGSIGNRKGGVNFETNPETVGLRIFY